MYWKLFAVTMLHCIFGMAPGMFIGALNPVELLVRDLANRTLVRYGVPNPPPEQVEFLWGLLNSMNTLGYCIGPIIIVISGDRLGRRVTVMLINTSMVIFSALLAISSKVTDSYELLMLNRLVVGMCDPVYMFTYVYLMECCDPQDGLVVAAICRVGTVCWYISGAALGLPQVMGTEDSWHYILVVPAGASFIYLLCAPLVPESPKHLLLTENSEQKCRQAIRFYYGPQVDPDLLMEEYRREIEFGSGTSTLREVMTTRHLRWPFFLCIAATLVPRLTGYDIDTFYSTQLLVDIGLDVEDAALYNLLILRLPILFIALIFIPLAKHVNSKTVLLAAVLAGSFSITIMTISEGLPESNLSIALLIVAIFIEMCATWTGSYFVAKILPGEICPQASRALTSAYSAAFGGFTSVVITVGFPPLSAAIGEMLTLLPLDVLSWAICVWLFKYMPDTNRNVNEIVAQWVPHDREDEAEEHIPLMQAEMHH